MATLLKYPAGDHLVYVEALPDSPQQELDLARAAAALANASGSVIVVGVQPADGAPPEPWAWGRVTRTGTPAR